MAATIALLLALAQQPAAAESPKLVVECEADVAFGEAITIDASKSSGLVSFTFKVYPRKKVHRDSDGKSAFFFAKPGPYAIFVVAAGPDGKQYEQELEARVQPLTPEEWRALAPPDVAAEAGSPHQERPQRPVPPPDNLGLRPKVRQWYDAVSGHAKATERARFTTALDTLAATVATKQITDRAVLAKALEESTANIDPTVRERWTPVTGGVLAVLDTLEPDQWFEALRTIVHALRVPA